ncbi:MAG: tRNA 2-selenouridine(34) synthase MnmH [Bacteroidia bacterium]
MPKPIHIDAFLELAKRIPVIDVRSPSEFEHGHIPNAHNLPLFSDEERALVGTCYKQKGKQTAIELGLEIVGPKLATFVKTARKLALNETILVHCWRGGMRSGSMAWLFETSGLNVNTLAGGYKKYRNKVLQSFSDKYTLAVLGGETGSGKTDILKTIEKAGGQIIDLESLAAHKGSSFGALGMKQQPTIEQFENNLFYTLQQLDPYKTIWIEDESKTIGRIFVPLPFWQQMAQSPLYRIQIPLEVRIKRLVREYGIFQLEQLKEAIIRIQKRLGGLDTQNCMQALHENDLHSVAAITLRYYDKAYNHLLNKKEAPTIFLIDYPQDDPEQIAALILKIHTENTQY